MQAKKHEDYQEECLRLKNTQQWISQKTSRLEEENANITQEISALKKSVNTAFDERLLLKQQMQQTVSSDLEKLRQVNRAPYFGRIDFMENGGKALETEYIGKFGLYDEKSGEIIVLDWRTPMANIYYSGIDEAVSYRAPNGIVEGKMLLKRRYVIENGELAEIHDEKSLQDNLKESITMGNDFLIESLNKSTSGRLKEIVATIQKEQNQIIRSESFLPLIVQGVAGSGKTTIALHRMAYLIYNGQNPKAEYMVVAPNKLFLNYIEEILPDLGVNNVVQTTFEDWALSCLGKKVKLNKEKDQLDTLLVGEEETVRLIALASKLRGSIVFQKVIDLALKKFEEIIIPGEDLKYEDITILSYKDLRQTYLVSNTALSIKQRVQLLGDYLKKKLKGQEEEIKKQLEMKYAEKIKGLKSSVTQVESVRKEIIALYDERDEKIKALKKWIPLYVKSYIKKIQLPTATQFYQELLEDKESLSKWLKKQVAAEDLEVILEGILSHVRANSFETEDLGPLLYIHMKLYGLEEEKKYAHIVVDEAQDLDEMKLVVLRKISSNDSFTLVGDLAQGIYGYKGINNWQRTMERVFSDKKYNYFEMTTSYRSTIEIIELANKVISKCTDFTPLLAKPVLRHGQKPLLIKCKDEKERDSRIYNDIVELQSNKMVSICIITKDVEEGKNIFQSLKKQGLSLQWLSSEEEQYEGGIAVMPSYLAKGLEFDAVLLYDVSWEKFSHNSLDIKLLYVMITRALHELRAYTITEPTILLDGMKIID